MEKQTVKQSESTKEASHSEREMTAWEIWKESTLKKFHQIA